MKNVSTKLPLPEGCTLNIKSFDQLSTTELYDILHVRAAVFIVEQNCVYQDIDYSDQTALQLWLTNDEGKGYGALIFQKALDAVRQYFPETKLVKIESQLTKLHFYERFGFRATSEPFMMEGLMHIDMELKLQ